MKKWLVKHNDKKISLKSFYNKTKEFADIVILNYNLDNPNYVGLNIIEKDFMKKEDHMTLNKLAVMLVEFKNDVDTKFVELNTKITNIDDKVSNLENKVNNGFKELDARMYKLENRMCNIEMCPTIQKELYLNK